VSRLSGERLGMVLYRMARRGLEQKNAPRRKGRGCFPTFDISPGAPLIPASRIERVLDDARDLRCPIEGRYPERRGA
jgi:hypothetical protein